MKTTKWIAFGTTILSGVICIVIYFVPWIIGHLFLGDTDAASSIGIIGGADGPTAVFVTRNSVPNYIPSIFFVLSLSLWLVMKFKCKKTKSA